MRVARFRIDARLDGVRVATVSIDRALVVVSRIVKDELAEKRRTASRISGRRLL